MLALMAAPLACLYERAALQAQLRKVKDGALPQLNSTISANALNAGSGLEAPAQQCQQHSLCMLLQQRHPNAA